jgi:hypothetical protein
VVHPLSPNFLHPPHLVPLVFKPLTKSIKSKAISLHSFPNGVNKNMVDESERDANGGRRVENKI